MTKCEGTIVWLFLWVVLSTVMPAQGESRYSSAVLSLGGSWQMVVFRDGMARLSCGSIDSIERPAGSFDYELWYNECEIAVNGASRKGVDEAKTGVSVMRSIPGERKGDTAGAVLTPKLKAFVDQMLESPLSKRMDEVIGQNPVFSEKTIGGLAIWTNSPWSRVPDEDIVAADSPKPQLSPAMGSQISQALVEHRVKSNAAAAVDPVSDAKESSSGFSGWLVIGLLAIAAFLTYRFIRLRLGS